MPDDSVLDVIDKITPPRIVARDNHFRAWLAEKAIALRVRASRALLVRFQRKRDATVLNRESPTGVRALLLGADSPLFKDHDLRSQFLALLSDAGHSLIIQENAIELLSSLDYAHQGNVEVDSSVGLVNDCEVIESIWKASTATRLQPRYVGSLVALRERLLAKGMAPGSLPLPEWMRGRTPSGDEAARA